MSIGYYVRKFPRGCSGVVVGREGEHTVIVADVDLAPREQVEEALRILTDKEIREWLAH